ncbi:unnamed protein product [Orchesella dallaii]|uniref:Calmodulin-binding transcription activator 1 n=1 Tax=Orchesella dallaii TaxID=48710 RepID=A0ABP1R4T6_9HEXA
MPERIKKKSCESNMPHSESQDSPTILNSDQSEETVFTFEFSDRSYRYPESETPCSSLSPASSCLQSPCSSTLTDSPQPTTADFCEFLKASAFEKDFSNLALTDREQRELYEAAKVIQKAYRSYKGRKKLEEEEKEKAAAVIIQNYYRRYKQYAYLRQVTQAAVVIQNQYRSYCENKRFKKCSQDTGSEFLMATTESDPENSLSHPDCNKLKQCSMGINLQRNQLQAAQKPGQFMTQSTNVWDCINTNQPLERTGRKREATVPTSVLEVHCPAPPKLAMSSSPSHCSEQLSSTFFIQSLHQESDFTGANF